MNASRSALTLIAAGQHFVACQRRRTSSSLIASCPPQLLCACKIAQLRFEPVVVAAAHCFEPGRLSRTKRAISARLRASRSPGQELLRAKRHRRSASARINASIAPSRSNGIAPPGRAEIAMLAEAVHGALRSCSRGGSSLDRRRRMRRTPSGGSASAACNQRSKASSASAAASSSASNLKTGSTPASTGRSLQKVAAEGVDRADARKLQLFERAVEPRALFAASRPRAPARSRGAAAASSRRPLSR